MQHYLVRAAFILCGIIGTHSSALAQDNLASLLGAQRIDAATGGLGVPLENGDRFGRSVAGLGDLDGDGISDIAVGARSDDDGATDAGAVYILFMNSDGTVKATSKISSTSGGLGVTLDASDFFGYSVASLGDLNGDGVRELAVGAPQDDDSGNNTGAIYVLFMNTDGTVNTVSKISNTAGGLGAVLSGGDSFGQAAGAPGDLTGDGVPDLLVGAPGDDTGGAGSGAMYLLGLTTTGTVSAVTKYDATNVPVTPGDALGGRHVACVGDVDGNGTPDLAAGAFHDDGAGSDRGAVWIIRLDASMNVIGHTEIGDNAGGFNGVLDDDDLFGMTVAPIGDWDNDGVPDIVVGSNRDDDGGEDVGALFILLLNTNATVRAWEKLSLAEHALPLLDHDRFGRALASVGDLRGDGSLTVAAGAGAGQGGGAVVLLFLKPICKADTNHDGQLTPADFTAWIVAFNAGATECDQNSDGSCTAADFTAWIANFNAGC